MRSAIDSILKGITEFFKKLTRGQKVRLGILAVVIIALAIVVVTILGQTTYSVLYTGLSADEAGEILEVLQGMGEDAQAQGSSTILVPEKRVSELRMTLAAQGYQVGGYDYSLFDQASGFGMTDLEKQTLIQYQLEAHVRSQILMTTKIKDCLVKINMPQESLFVVSTGGKEASASVMLEVSGGATLTQAEANAIAAIVMQDVSGLKAENIAIIDTNMNIYKVGGDESGSGNVSSQLALEREVQTELETQVENLLTPVFGSSAVKTAVNVTLNFDDVVSETIEFAPPVEDEQDGIVVSMYELYENSRADGAASGVAGTDSNGMGSEEYPYGTLDDDELYSKVVRETNYEINKTTTQIAKAKGTITTLSIAVLLDSEAVAEDYTQSVKNLVASAIGVNADYISVERLPFGGEGDTISDALAAQNELLADLQFREFIKTAVTWGVIVLLVIIVLLFLRSIVKIARGNGRPVALAGGVGGTVDLMAGEGGALDVRHYPEIDLSAKPETIENLEKLIDRDPEAVTQLLRNWISDE